MIIVLDTNVLLSGTFWEGDSFRILQLIESGKLKCFISEPILSEYRRVVHSQEIIDKVNEKNLDIKASALKAMELFVIVEPKRKIDFVKDDPDDNKVIECAAEAQAEYIVTQDRKHLLKLGTFEGIKIISPAEFLRILK